MACRREGHQMFLHLNLPYALRQKEPLSYLLNTLPILAVRVYGKLTQFFPVVELQVHFLVLPLGYLHLPVMPSSNKLISSATKMEFSLNNLLFILKNINTPHHDDLRR